MRQPSPPDDEGMNKDERVAFIERALAKGLQAFEKDRDPEMEAVALRDLQRRVVADHLETIAQKVRDGSVTGYALSWDGTAVKDSFRFAEPAKFIVIDFEVGSKVG